MNKTLKIILNIAIFLVIIGFFVFMVRSFSKEERLSVERTPEAPFDSKYRKCLTIIMPQTIDRFELYDDKLYVSAGQTIYVHESNGEASISFTVMPNVRDIAVENELIYVLYPTCIEVYDAAGQLHHEWEACSPLSDYCSFALAGDYVFVTDAENKNICQYTKKGNFVRFIQSLRGFIIPSYAFDIVSRGDTIFCVNSGRHSIETYTLDGKFIAAFGSPGAEAGDFAGCCNPVYITFAPDGALLTSEKGNPRVSSYERDGKFIEMLLNNSMMGGGTSAYQIKADNHWLFIAGGNRITAFISDSNKRNGK
jgi:hypothetical protein